MKGRVNFRGGEDLFSLKSCTATASSACGLQAGGRPNVVLILTDDMGWGDLGIHGNKVIDTPRLDRLGGESVRFDNFYVHPCCAPTRASLLTGRHFLRTGVRHVHGGGDFLHRHEVTMAQWFRANGYATGMWGKWHSGKTSGYLPWERGFDEAYMADLYQHHDAGGLMNGERIKTPGWTTEVLTDLSLKFIEQNKDKPFFAYVPHLAPHSPLAAKDELVEKYRQRGLGRHMATAFAMVEMIDDSLGRILDKLDELKLAENTIVLFLSDNGPQYFGMENCSPADYAARYPLALKGHKGSMWENGIKGPFFARFPGRFAPRVVERLADVQDVLPTLIELCGLANRPAGTLPMDGRSIAAYLEGRDELPPKTSVIFSNVGWPPVKDAGKHPWPDWQTREYAPVSEDKKEGLDFLRQLAGLRTESFKLLRNPGYAEGMTEVVEQEVLVDMTDDPLEDCNLAVRDPERAAAMRNRLDAWFAEIKTEPHAYAPPVFEIGADTTGVIYLYGMSRRLGGAVNFGLDTRHWDNPGDGGEYQVHVTEAGQYRLELNGDFEGELELELEIEGVRPHRATVVIDPGICLFAAHQGRVDIAVVVKKRVADPVGPRRRARSLARAHEPHRLAAEKNVYPVRAVVIGPIAVEIPVRRHGAHGMAFERCLRIQVIARPRRAGVEIDIDGVGRAAQELWIVEAAVFEEQPEAPAAGPGIRYRLVVAGIGGEGRAGPAQITGAEAAPRLFAGARECRRQQCDVKAADGQDHEQFRECESGASHG